VGKTLPTTGASTVPLAALAAAFILAGLALASSRSARSRTDGSCDVEGEIDGRG
jgi:LPXTG-motif cell wall-anchored protein